MKVRQLIAASVLLALCLATRASAVTAITFEQLTVDDTAGGVPFTLAKIEPNGASSGPSMDIATCTLETAAIRYLYDIDTTISATVGVPLSPGATITLTGHDNIRRFRAIRTTGSSGLLDCIYTAR